MSDFGLASCPEFDLVENSRSIQEAGNAQWMSIELLYSRGDLGTLIKTTKKSDMWALGMFAIEVRLLSARAHKALPNCHTFKILTGGLPFPNRGDMSIFVGVSKGNRPSRPEHPECCNTLWNVVEGCWKESPDERLTAKQALEIVEKLRGGCRVVRH